MAKDRQTKGDRWHRPTHHSVFFFTSHDFGGFLSASRGIRTAIITRRRTPDAEPYPSNLINPRMSFMIWRPARARNFKEMPGMCLTTAQAARLWQLSPARAEELLSDLVQAGFLVRRDGQRYRLPSSV